MKLRELIRSGPAWRGTGLAFKPLRRRLLRAVLTGSHAENGPTLQLIRERLLSRSDLTEYQGQEAVSGISGRGK
jgi:hypothetical protein